MPSETLTVPEAAAGLTDTLIVVAEPYVADETLVIVVVVAREVTVTVWVAPLAALYVADCAVCAVSEPSWIRSMQTKFAPRLCAR